MSQYSHLTADLTNDNSSVTKIVRLIGPDRLVLDVGCAHGYVAEALRGQGCKVVGVERNDEDAARARTHCEEVLVADLDEPGWADRLAGRRFDAVVFSDVLEHLREPARVLGQSLDLLDPAQGIVVASVPNVAHLSVRLELLLGSFRREELGILDETHIHFYTRDTLEELFTSCGLRVESWDCTTNEIADSVVASYLGQAGMTFTPELRQRFADFEAMAFQFVVVARPARGVVIRRPPLLKKPLQTMQESWRAVEETNRALEEAHRVAARLRTTPAEIERPRDGGLRVLQVVHQFLPRHVAGTEIYCADLSFGLARRGHAVRVLSGAPYWEDVGTRVEWERDAGIVVEKIPATRAYRRLGSVGGFFDRFDNPEARRTIRARLDQMRPDVVHIQHLLYLSAELIPECRMRGIPVVVTLHDYWFLCHRVKLKRLDGALCDGPARGWNCCQCLSVSRPVRSHLNPAAVAINLYRYAYLTRQLLKADRILSPSRFLRDVFARNGVPAERITVCDHGTAAPAGAAGTESPRTDGPVRFGFLGSFMPEKGVHVLIDAFNRLPAGAAELHVFGMVVDPAYDADLRQRARHPGIRWRGALPYADRWQALHEIDVLVVPSIWYENAPLTLHEAQVAGTPAIASRIGGIPEFVQDGLTGLTFPSGDVEALAACLRRVVDEPACLGHWRAAISPPKTMDAHVLEVEAMYRELHEARRDDRAASGRRVG